MKSKRETWLVFFRTKSGKLSSMEINGNFSRKEALDIVCAKKKLDRHAGSKNCLEFSLHGPIIKRMCYV